MRLVKQAEKGGEAPKTEMNAKAKDEKRSSHSFVFILKMQG